MSGLTVERLQALLKEQKDEEEKRRQENNASTIPGSSSMTKEDIHSFFRKTGMMAPLEGFWERPIPADVYKCPLSEPMTTLVDYHTLPRSIQGLYTGPPPSTGGDPSTPYTIEIDRKHLLTASVLEEEEQKGAAAAAAASTTVGLNRRPLTGNMTNKLNEYTRGVSGQCRPFRPGGLGNSDEGHVGDLVEGEDTKVDPFLTPDAIENSFKVLRQGTKASWEDGSLITAPPGVDFHVGLSYDDIYGKEGNKDAGVAATSVESAPSAYAVGDDTEQMLRVDDVLGMQPSAPLVSDTRGTNTLQWEPNFLDDDSLFGSSSSESGSSDDSDEETEKDENDKDDESEGTASIMDQEIEEGHTEPTVAMVEEIVGSEEEIDGLLKELSRAEAKTKKELVAKGDKEEINMNPLELAERQAKMQLDANRKSWATTALLPIDDFHSWIPNPALVFPFTLDPFQQQAVARLERNESVFVAAHTSAGKTVVGK